MKGGMGMRIALTGNPNSGKTTMFNILTGKNESVGNWAGVTVDKKEASVKRNIYRKEDLVVVDLPGAYSMSPFTSEESVTSSYIKEENPDVIINIVDATNLSRSLFFTTQILELGIPVVVALNKSDINEKKETVIDTVLLSEKLGCPVIETASVSSHNKGISKLVDIAVSVKNTVQKPPFSQNSEILTDKASVEKADRERFEFVNSIVSKVESRKIHTSQRNTQDKLDAILTNKWLGIPIFAVVMFLVFQTSQAWIGPWIADALVSLLESFQSFVGSYAQDAEPILQTLLVDGVIGGFIAVVGFLPLVMVRYFLIALLEDCGYMARVSVVLDQIFKRVGLSGKSVIPFVIGTGCAVPGVMACRTIRNENERKATAMLAPFMPCGAKLPVIALFAGAFFGDASWVGTLMYFAGILIIFFGALIVNRIAGNRNRKSYFIIELPEYKIPNPKGAFLSMCARGWAYIVKAGTIILVCNTLVQIMQTFTWRFEYIDFTTVENTARSIGGATEESIAKAISDAADTSILASIATPFSYIMLPIIGFASWQLAAAAITGFIAKENVVGTIAVCFGITNFINVGDGYAGEFLALSKVAALSYLMFNLFTPPCFAAIGAMNSEIKSRKWFWGGIALQFATGFSVSFLVYQMGTLITEKRLGEAFVPGCIAITIIVLFIVMLIRKQDKNKAAQN